MINHYQSISGMNHSSCLKDTTRVPKQRDSSVVRKPWLTDLDAVIHPSKNSAFDEYDDDYHDIMARKKLVPNSPGFDWRIKARSVANATMRADLVEAGFVLRAARKINEQCKLTQVEMANALLLLNTEDHRNRNCNEERASKIIQMRLRNEGIKEEIQVYKQELDGTKSELLQLREQVNIIRRKEELFKLRQRIRKARRSHRARFGKITAWECWTAWESDTDE